MIKFRECFLPFSSAKVIKVFGKYKLLSHRPASGSVSRKVSPADEVCRSATVKDRRKDTQGQNLFSNIV